jgi:hypothetical protein
MARRHKVQDALTSRAFCVGLERANILFCVGAAPETAREAGLIPALFRIRSGHHAMARRNRLLGRSTPVRSRRSARAANTPLVDRASHTGAVPRHGRQLRAVSGRRKPFFDGEACKSGRRLRAFTLIRHRPDGALSAAAAKGGKPAPPARPPVEPEERAGTTQRPNRSVLNYRRGFRTRFQPNNRAKHARSRYSRRMWKC